MSGQSSVLGHAYACARGYVRARAIIIFGLVGVVSGYDWGLSFDLPRVERGYFAEAVYLCPVRIQIIDISDMTTFRRWGAVLALALAGLLASCGTSETLEVRIIHTTDVHGNLFSYDYVGDRPSTGGMARLSSMMQAVRAESPATLLLDGGDMLQGEPITYYSNYIDTTATNAVAVAMNLLGYDAATMGNHDLEPGHAVYDRFVRDVKFPVLAANAISTETGEPYFRPYVTIERGGARITVLGLITPAIPQWLPEHLWSGMRFDDIVESAKVWVPRLLESEHPDLLVAMIHSGYENNNEDYLENAGATLAQTVPGIDLILMGHDHRQHTSWVHRSETDSVLLVNPSNHLDLVSDIRISIEKRGGKVVGRKLDVTLSDVNAYEADTAFMRTMASYEQGARDFLSRRIGMIDAPVDARDALFGPSAYMDVIHRMQLATVGADISFAAPLNTRARLSAGDIYVRDLFKWCPFSNHLYVMELTGEEVRGYLEHSYAGWVRTMTSREEGLINVRPDAKKEDRYKTAVPTYNYSAAQGIDYTVDVSKPAGQRVNITQLSSGEPFDPARRYRVAINSYRAGGAGGMLTVGSGIPREDLRKRIVGSSDYDQFFSLLRFFETKGVVTPVNPANWSFIPTAWAQAGEARDREFLFSK